MSQEIYTVAMFPSFPLKELWAIYQITVYQEQGNAQKIPRLLDTGSEHINTDIKRHH